MTNLQPSNSQNPLQEKRDHPEQFVIRIGGSFEAAARGKIAIVCATIVVALLSFVALYK